MLSIEKVPELLAEIPKGDWVALAHDETRVVAYGAELQNVVRRAKESGEDDPVVIRVPRRSLIFLRSSSESAPSMSDPDCIGAQGDARKSDSASRNGARFVRASESLSVALL